MFDARLGDLPSRRAMAKIDPGLSIGEVAGEELLAQDLEVAPGVVEHCRCSRLREDVDDDQLHVGGQERQQSLEHRPGRGLGALEWNEQPAEGPAGDQFGGDDHDGIQASLDDVPGRAPDETSVVGRQLGSDHRGDHIRRVNRREQRSFRRA